MLCEICSGVRQECAFSATPFNNVIEWTLRRVIQDYAGVQVGANVHVSDITYTANIVLLSDNYLLVLEAVL